MKNMKQYLIESSLSRLWRKLDKHDIGIISAHRGNNTKPENRKRSTELKAALLRKGYSVTSVKGSYIENLGSKDEKEVGELSYFVADHEDTGNLKRDLKKLGEKFDQDSILFKEKGKDAQLIGTSRRDNAYPGYNKVEKIGKAKFGNSMGQFFSRVRGRKFAFEGIEEEKIPDHRAGLRGLHVLADKVWSEKYTYAEN